MDRPPRSSIARRVSGANLDRYGDGSVAEAYIQEPFHLRRLSIAMSLLKAGIRKANSVPRVLEIGGLKPTGMALTEMGFDVTTVNLGFSGAWDQRILRVQADATDDLPFRAGSFAAAFAGELIEHLFDPVAFLREIHRVLDLPGVVVLTTPNLAPLGDRIAFLVGRSPRQVDPIHSYLRFHIRPFTASKLIEILIHCGFTNIELRTNEISLRLIGRKIRVPLFAQAFPSLGRSLIVRAEKG